jgi:cation:H+ antiporter
MIFLNVVILVAGFGALVKGADIFVDGSSSLARIFKVPTLIIGLTIVACGTSMPELAVSTSASISGADEIALSNVVGSNIFNLLGILGVCALLYRLPVDSVIIKRDYPVTIISTALFLIFLLVFLLVNKVCYVGRVPGIVLLVLYALYVAFLIFDAKKHPSCDDNIKELPLWKSILFIVLGLALVIGGGEAVVYASQKIARFLGMTETLIGLTIVAIGTSLPELVTSLVAAKKDDTALAIGNVIGSNIFNLMFILGFAAVINPLSVNIASIYDLIVLSAANLMVWIMSLTKRRIGKVEGLVMILFYAAETVFAVLR